jgi:hypothetical protein
LKEVISRRIVVFYFTGVEGIAFLDKLLWTNRSPNVSKGLIAAFLIVGEVRFASTRHRGLDCLHRV